MEVNQNITKPSVRTTIQLTKEEHIEAIKDFLVKKGCTINNNCEIHICYDEFHGTNSLRIFTDSKSLTPAIARDAIS